MTQTDWKSGMQTLHNKGTISSKRGSSSTLL